MNISLSPHKKIFVLACLTEARGDPTRSSSSPSPLRSTAAREPLKYSPMRISELLRGAGDECYQNMKSIKGDNE